MKFHFYRARRIFLYYYNIITRSQRPRREALKHFIVAMKRTDYWRFAYVTERGLGGFETAVIVSCQRYAADSAAKVLSL